MVELTSAEMSRSDSKIYTKYMEEVGLSKFTLPLLS